MFHLLTLVSKEKFGFRRRFEQLDKERNLQQSGSTV
jgi:hypothetical protein